MVKTDNSNVKNHLRTESDTVLLNVTSSPTTTTTDATNATDTANTTDTTNTTDTNTTTTVLQSSAELQLQVCSVLFFCLF